MRNRNTKKMKIIRVKQGKKSEEFGKKCKNKGKSRRGEKT